MNNKMYVTRPFLPPLNEFIEKVKGIYGRNVLTNGGPEEEEFEDRMRAFLQIQYFYYVANGTLALQLALHALDITEGEIITTPFTYVATTSAILWERCKPVFADIDPMTFNLDPARIEESITPRTKAILPVHVFGHPCDMDAIESIAAKHGLKVIYDAAHAFGVRKNGISICTRGHISALSFHATKSFHTIEGGACVTDNEGIAWRLNFMKRFGHGGDDHLMLGINAKQDEFNAAMGNLNLDHLNEITAGRKQAWEIYERLLGRKYQTRNIDAGVEYNYAYFPVVFPNEADLLAAFKKLAQIEVYPRRYFYPSLTRLPYLDDKRSCPIAEDISRRIACLPLFSAIKEDDVRRICEVLLCD